MIMIRYELILAIYKKSDTSVINKSRGCLLILTRSSLQDLLLPPGEVATYDA